jgi:poly(3-hydroxybutyrate) depolymerase
MARQSAIVTVVSPLAVQVHGSLTSTAVQEKGSHVPALAVNDKVWVDYVDGQLVVDGKVVAA